MAIFDELNQATEHGVFFATEGIGLHWQQVIQVFVAHVVFIQELFQHQVLVCLLARRNVLLFCLALFVDVHFDLSDGVFRQEVYQGFGLLVLYDFIFGVGQ